MHVCCLNFNEVLVVSVVYTLQCKLVLRAIETESAPRYGAHVARE